MLKNIFSATRIYYAAAGIRTEPRSKIPSMLDAQESNAERDRMTLITAVQMFEFLTLASIRLYYYVYISFETLTVKVDSSISLHELDYVLYFFFRDFDVFALFLHGHKQF